MNTTSGPSLLGEKETNFVRGGLVVEFWREKFETFERVEVFRVDPVLGTFIKDVLCLGRWVSQVK